MPTSRPLKNTDPTEVGGYRLSGRLGAGGQGVVYLAEDGEGRPVAVKVLHSHRTDDPRVRELFLREARSAQKVGPFGTARVLDVGTADDLPYIVSEYIDGRSLQQLVERDGPLDEAALQRLAIGTASALAAIHRAGIVHRDYKPANVLLALDGPRVIDFGIAGLDASGIATATGKGEGTPAYMSPEQATGGRLTATSDVFSWAATLLYAATGRPPFGKDAIALVLNRIVNLEPDLSALSAPLRPLVERCLAKDPALRPSAQDLAVALVGPPGSGEHPITETTVPSPPRSRRRRFVALAGVLVLVAALLTAWRLGPLSEPDGRFTDARAGDLDGLFPADTGGGTGVDLLDVAVAGSSGPVIAVGSGGGAVVRPVFLASYDTGTTWEQVTLGPAPSRAIAQGVVVGARGWLAFGVAENADSGTEQTVLWTSPDARQWRPASRTALRAFDDAPITAIAATSTGFAAIGKETDAIGRTRLKAWHSADGIEWKAADVPTTTLPEGISHGRISVNGDLLVMPVLVGAGTRFLRSADSGRTWTITPASFPDDGLVSPAAGGFLRLSTKIPEAKCSADGLAWKACGSLELAEGESLEALLQGTDELGRTRMIAQTGFDRKNEHVLRLYQREDDGRWKRLREYAGHFQPSASVITDQGTVLTVGTDFAATDPTGSGPEQQVRLAEPGRPVTGIRLGKVVAPLPDRGIYRVVTAAGLTVAVGGANAGSVILTTTDGDRWNRVERAHSGDLYDVAHGPAGWAAVGAGLVVTSRDGKAWTRLPASAFKEPDPDRQFQSVAAGPKGYVVAAPATETPLWFSSDLRTFTRPRTPPFQADRIPMTSLAAGPDGFYAAGRLGSGAVQVWSSATGQDWRALPPFTPNGGTETFVTRLLAREGSLVMAGTSLVGKKTLPFVAVSADGGERWKTSWPLVAWDGRIDDLAQVGGELVAVGCTRDDQGRLSGTSWISSDGAHWLPDTAPALPDTEVEEVLGVAPLGHGRLVTIRFGGDATREDLSWWQAKLNPGGP